MKIISLNIWGGKVYQPLLDFITHYNNEIDIFCFQEVFNRAVVDKSRIMHDARMNIFEELEFLLPQHEGLFASSQTNEEGLAMFVKKHRKIKKESDIFVYRWKDAMINNDARTMGRNMQYIHFDKEGQQYTVGNFHGLWNGKGKLDSLDRISQSNAIKEFIESIKGEKIVCGDFNLLPRTKSMLILEENMRNLITEYKITSTRSGLYKKHERFADYILVSENVKVKDFKVLQDEVSDHLPLYLEFS